MRDKLHDATIAELFKQNREFARQAHLCINQLYVTLSTEGDFALNSFYAI